MPYYDVKQGDCISSIASEKGFFWETIWNRQENADLRQTRLNPNALLPGDSLFVPDIQPKDESGATELHHHFRLKGVPVRLRFRLLDCYGNPRPNLPYTIEVDGKTTSGVSDGDAMIETIIEPKAAKAKITVQPSGAPEEKYEFNLGYMNPVEHITGIQGRLRNLGFYDGEIDGELNDATRYAVRKFQARAGLPQTGEVDDQLISAVNTAHGG